ncbi:hypothetical protein ACMDCR_01415 [Labrys okinawensis]|uniref:hypothetical protein n=1 Tax=Labrys okinawensis TaxID=346911 RepID=UPI0039BD3E83
MNWAETVPQFMNPSNENMPDVGAATMKNANTAIVPQIAPSSGRINALRNGDTERRRASRIGAAAPLGSFILSSLVSATHCSPEPSKAQPCLVLLAMHRSKLQSVRKTCRQSGRSALNVFLLPCVNWQTRISLRFVAQN